MFGIFRNKGRPFISDTGKLLSDLIPGQKAFINGIDEACHGIERKRLMDLGFVPGTLVEVAVSSPFRDPTAYRVKGGLIALRKSQASKINIESVQ